MENNSNVRRFTGTAIMIPVAVVAFFMSIGLSVQVAQAGPAMSRQEQAQNAAQARTQVQPQLYLWPIAGAKTGDNILFQPQQYVDGNLNFGNLIIGAPEGTPVVAPVDGVIHRPGVAVKWGTGMQTYHTDEDRTWNEQISSVVAEGGYGVPDRCVSMTLGIRTADGDRLWFSGLNGDMVLKDGQQIHRGDTWRYVRLCGLVRAFYKGASYLFFHKR